MKKTSIFLTIGLVLVAILAGCNNEVVYPHFPTNAVITQTGDFITGQEFDNSKFQVTVYYLDGSKTTIKNPALQITDTDGIQGGETVTFEAGNDYYGDPVTQKATISRVYDVEYITVKANEASYAIDDTFADGQELKPELFTVTAYYNANKSVVLGASNYTVKMSPAAGVDTASQEYADATDVAAVATVTLNEGVGGAEADKITATVDVTASKAAVVVGEVKAVTGIASTSINLKNYVYTPETLPPVDYSKVILNVETVGGTSASTTLTADKVEGVDVYYVNIATKLPLDEKNGDYDLTNTELGIGIVAEYNGVQTPTVRVGRTTTSIEIVSCYIEEGKRVILGGADLPEINPADYKVVLTEGSNKTLLDSLTAEDFIYVDETGEEVTGTMPAYNETPADNGKVYVTVKYQGVVAEEGIEFVAVDEDPANVTGIKATFDGTGLAVPAKAVYTSAIPTVDTIKSGFTVIATMDKGEPKNVSAEAEYEYQFSGTDLTGVDELTVEVTYETFTTTVSVPLAEPVAEEIAIEAEYSLKDTSGNPMYGATVDWTLTASNTTADYTFDYEGAYRVYRNNSPASALPTDANDWFEEKGSYLVVIDLADGTTAASEAVAAPTAVTPYATVDKDTIEFTFDKPVVVGSKIADVVTAGDFVAVEGSWTPNGEVDAPEVTAVTPDYPDANVALGANTVKITVSYIGNDGQAKTFDKAFEFEGVDEATAVIPSLKEGVEVITGQAYTTDMFDFVVTMVSGATYTTETLPEDFVIEVKENTVAGVADSAQTVEFTYSDGNFSGTTSCQVTPVADYPASVVAEYAAMIYGGSAYSDANFKYTITWKSGNAYDEGGAPSVTYSYEPTLAGENGTAETVTITWKCGTKEGTTTASVTPGVNPSV